MPNQLISLDPAARHERRHLVEWPSDMWFSDNEAEAKSFFVTRLAVPANETQSYCGCSAAMCRALGDPVDDR